MKRFTDNWFTVGVPCVFFYGVAEWGHYVLAVWGDVLGHHTVDFGVFTPPFD